MFNPFKKSESNDVRREIAIEQAPKKKTVIEEIHETFYSEVDRLLEEASIAHSLDTDKEVLIEKCKRLKALGFTNTKEVKAAETEILRLDQLKKQNEEKKSLTDAINYFSVAYPIYKFITEDSVKKICKKYGLIYGAIDKYIGTVPEKNLKQIETFSVHENDECHVYRQDYTDWNGSVREVSKKYLTKTEREKMNEGKGNNHHYMMLHYTHNNVSEIDMKCLLEICAPPKDFDMRGMEVKDFHLKSLPPAPIDPVVLKPVIFNATKYYLIITAWGDEASDEMVVNNINN